jgi:hypothetical protein
MRKLAGGKQNQVIVILRTPSMSYATQAQCMLHKFKALEWLAMQLDGI